MIETSFARVRMLRCILGAAQVEPPVADPDRLVDALLVELERERRRAREDLELVGLDLDLAGRHRRVDGLRRALDDRPARADDELVAELVRDLGCAGRVLGVDDDLDDTVLVAHVDEDEAAVVAARRDPAGDRDGPAHVPDTQRAAALVAPTAHELSVSRRSLGETGCSSPPRRSRQPSAPAMTTARAPVRPAWVIWPLNDRPA